MKKCTKCWGMNCEKVRFPGDSFLGDTLLGNDFHWVTFWKFGEEGGSSQKIQTVPNFNRTWSQHYFLLEMDLQNSKKYSPRPVLKNSYIKMLKKPTIDWFLYDREQWSLVGKVKRHTFSVFLIIFENFPKKLTAKKIDELASNL